MTVRIAAFARLREIVTVPSLELPEPATAEDAWHDLCERYPDLAPLKASTRFAVNGRFAGDDTALRQDDELALLPPFGGG